MNKEKIQSEVNVLERYILEAGVILEALKSQLAEAEKPKLGHGDWWWKSEERLEARIFLKEIKDKKRDCVALPDCLLTTIGSAYEGQPIEGNIFADLKALSKPLEEFETRVSGGGKIRIRCYDSDKIEIKVSAGYISHATGSLAEMEKIREVLGRVIAFAKNKAGKD